MVKFAIWACIDRSSLQSDDWVAWHPFHWWIFPYLGKGILQLFLELLSSASLHLLTKHSETPFCAHTLSLTPFLQFFFQWWEEHLESNVYSAWSGTETHSWISPLSGDFLPSGVWQDGAVSINPIKVIFPFCRTHIFAHVIQHSENEGPSAASPPMKGSSLQGCRIGSLRLLVSSNLMNIYVFIAAWNSSGPMSTASRGMFDLWAWDREQQQQKFRCHRDSCRGRESPGIYVI